MIPLAAAASSSGWLLPSVPQVRTVLTPIECSSGIRDAASLTGGPQVRPLTVHGWPSTLSCQLPWLPVTFVTPGPPGVVVPGVPLTWNSQSE